MIQKHAESLWSATQKLQFLGIELGARMTVVELSKRRLALISPIRMQSELKKALADIGEVSVLIAPNLFHHLFMQEAQEAFPEAETWAIAGLDQKRPDLRIDHVLDSTGSFADVLSYRAFEGLEVILPTGRQKVGETVFFHNVSRSLIVADSATHLDHSCPWKTRVAARLFRNYNRLRPTIFEKLGSRDKDAVERSIRKILEWDFERVIPAHGTIVNHGGKEKLREAYEWFLSKDLREA